VLAVGGVEVGLVELVARRDAGVEDAEGLQGAEAVGRLVDADAVDAEGRLDLDQVDVDPALAEGDRGPQPSDAGSHHEYPHVRLHLSVRRAGCDRRLMGWQAR
jgi:hypothetical protein